MLFCLHIFHIVPHFHVSPVCVFGCEVIFPFVPWGYALKHCPVPFATFFLFALRLLYHLNLSQRLSGFSVFACIFCLAQYSFCNRSSGIQSLYVFSHSMFPHGCTTLSHTLSNTVQSSNHQCINALMHQSINAPKHQTTNAMVFCSLAVEYYCFGDLNHFTHFFLSFSGCFRPSDSSCPCSPCLCIYCIFSSSQYTLYVFNVFALHI